MSTKAQNLPFSCLPRLYFLLSAIVPLYLSRILCKSTLFTQNKPNFRKAGMNVNEVLTKDYENKNAFTITQNKPNQTQFTGYSNERNYCFNKEL